MLTLDIGTNLRYMELWTQQKQYREELQAMVRTDALTGLQNLAGVIDLHTAFEGQEALYLPDGIHPTQQGARKIAATVAKVIDPEAKTEPRGFFGMGGR